MKYCRIDLSKTNYNELANWCYLTTFNELSEIYFKYCKYKKFKSVMPLFDGQFYDPKVDVIGYKHNTKLVAFSLIRRYDSESAESIQFAWDYSNPELHLGINSLKTECAIYKARGYRYLYLGEAHNYKSQIDGYELLGPV